MTETGEISPADAAVAIFKARLVAASPLVDEALDLADELVDEVRRLRTELARTEGDLGVAIREATRAREALKTINEWATAVHGGTKSPADIWPGLRRAIDEGLAQ